MLYYNRKYFFPALFFAPDIKSCCNLAPGSINSSDLPAVSFYSEDLCKAVRYVRKPPTSADSSQPLVYCRFCLRIMGLFLICQWTWRYVTAEPQSEAVNVNHVMKCMAVFWWQTLLTFLLSCMKEIVVWSPCFPSCDVTEALFNGSFLCVPRIKRQKDSVFTLTCNCLPVANTEEEFSAACWFAFFIIKEKEFFHQFLIDLKWVTVICSVETNHTGPLIDCELFWSVS